MKMFKSYSPLPASPWLCREWGGGGGGDTHTKRQEDLRGGSSSAAAWSKHVQRLPLIEKICFHLSQMTECKRRGKRNNCLELRWWGGEERSCLLMVGRVWGKDQEEVRERQSFSTDKCNQGWPPSWLLKGQTVHNINPSHCLQTAVSVFF